MGRAEEEAVVGVVRSGVLSGFYGSWSDEFWGGEQVRRFEAAWAELFKAPYAVSVNSATSGLLAALGAVGIGPGDEVIVPPYTMSATVATPLFYGAVPVFVDIEPETFCLDPDKVRRAITDRTRAIVVVNLFGHPGRLRELRALADEKGLVLIEDNAQAPLAEENGVHTGNVGHIGVASLNFHKHIHTGEGGVCVTADKDLAQRMQMIRNHGENVVEAVEMENIADMVGLNLRLTELQAAIGLAQLDRVEEHVAARRRVAEGLSRGLEGLEGLTVPAVRPGCRHVYYVWAMRCDEKRLGVSRAAFCKALAAEGFPHFTGYVRPLYLLPLFQRRIAIGGRGYPFDLAPHVDYSRGICPVCERMHFQELVCFEPCANLFTDADTELLVEAVRKVHGLRGELAGENA
jgi:dTDP-4-amino-4,6-dideoxygalactose transaminase